MNCPACKAPVDPSSLLSLSRKEAAIAILTDWRIWLMAFGLTAATGMLVGALGLPPGSVGGAGGAVGIMVAVRMARLRRCPACKATIEGPPPATS